MTIEYFYHDLLCKERLAGKTGALCFYLKLYEILPHRNKLVRQKVIFDGVVKIFKSWYEDLGIGTFELRINDEHTYKFEKK